MHIAVDLDGTIDAAPALFQGLLASLRACGHVISIVTGASSPEVTQEIIEGKQNYLAQLGLADSYSNLVVIPAGGPGEDKMSDMKAQWCKENRVDILIDNKKKNADAAAAAGIPLCLVPWASRV